MKISEIQSELGTLDRKRSDINEAILESQGEAAEVLGKALAEMDKKISAFKSTEFIPLSTIIYLTASLSAPSINVGEAAKITTLATFSDGTSRDMSVPYTMVNILSDFDDVADNDGYITSVNIDDYKGKATTYRIVKTSGGFNVVDRGGDVQGLQVTSALAPNKYQVTDVSGVGIGITFTTDGNETPGDNWLLDVYLVSAGTTFIASPENIVTIDENGVVTAVGGGTVDITVINGSRSFDVRLNVVDTIPPEPPMIDEVLDLGAGDVEVYFSGSTSLDAAHCNLYINNVLDKTGIVESPVILALVNDGTVYNLTMTAVDTSGNESEHTAISNISPV